MALAFPLNPQAEETIDHSGLYIEGEIAAGFPTEDGLDEGAYYGGRAGYRFNNYLAAEIESGHADVGAISFVPLMGNLRIHPFPGKTIDPYILAGLGGLFNDIDVDEEEISSVVEDVLIAEFGEVAEDLSVSTDVDIENAFAGQVGVGTLIHLTENLSAFVEAKILLAQADVKTSVTVSDDFDSITGSAKESVDLHTVFVGGGLRLRF